jgi:aspartate carbamoyltransferase catalytic subunit
VDFPRHLLGIDGLARGQIEAVLAVAARIKRARAAARGGGEAQAAQGRAELDRLRGALAGKLVVTLFFEASTRTRSSFEAAARALGADVIAFQKEGSSVSKGETLADTVRNLEAVGADAIVLRHPAAGAPLVAARAVRASVINAGDGAHEHPTQALLDALSLREKLGALEGKTVAIIGDIAHSRVARSNVFCLSRLGVRVRVAGPRTLLPMGIEHLGCQVVHSREQALEGADAVMALRIQQERIGDARLPSTKDYSLRWRIDAAATQRMAPGAVVLHPGPVNRGVEISSEVLDGPRSLVMDQVDSGVAVRMAVLALTLRANLPAPVREGNP